MRARVVGVVVAVLVLVPGTASAEGWVWPLAGPRSVARPFEPPTTVFGPGHRGADLAGAPGAAVRAAGPGRVSYAGMLAGRGVVVVVHGDLRTTYEPLAPSVRVGDAVDAGAVIGRLAEGGHCPGCLHWGLLRGDVYLDPVQLVRRGPSRLLPVPAAVDPAGSATAGRAAPPPAGSPAALEPAAEPRLSLRAAQAPWSAAALVALLAGLALLVRPSRRPPSPPAAPAVTAPAAATSAGAPMVAAPRCELVDFARERSRRRIA